MQHKWMVLFTMLVLVSLALAPVGTLQAHAQDTTPDCPPFASSFMRDKGFLHSLPPECVEFYKTSGRETNTIAQAQAAGPTTVSGPDGFGYTYNDTVAYNWISASTNSNLASDDEFTGPIDIGFNFPFYGMPQSQLYFSTNGLITFGAGSSDRSGSDIPNDMYPNNLIAPFWDDLKVGNPYNSGAIYTSQAGNSPNRYFVVEWRNVEYWDGTENISFEAILHENGDIVFQYQSLPSAYWPIVAIEDSAGYEGLPYSVNWNIPLHAIRFTYPAPAARVFASPKRAGGFAPLGGHKEFNITVANPGTLGTDTYDITISSHWSVTFYASNGVTPLTDTDADGVIDTGPLPQGTSTNVIARFRTPDGAQIGDNNTGFVTVTSSLSLSKTQAIMLQMGVPAGFANVFQDNGDGAMSFMTVDSDQIGLSKLTTDNYFGYNPAVIDLPNGNYLYAWHKLSSNANNAWTDLEYVLLNRTGNITLPVTKLTNNSSTTMFTGDYDPSIAVAPNGTIGIVWYRYIENSSTDEVNYNIYFATLNSSGNLLTGPTNITNNTIWGARSDSHTPRFYSPTIAASDDDRFIIGWEAQRWWLIGRAYDIWYTIQSSAGTSVFPPTALGDDHMSWEPVLNPLTGGKVIMAWGTDTGKPYYAVIGSNGVISTPATSLHAFGRVYYPPDAVQLPNGKVALAWTSMTPYGNPTPGVELAILDASYQLLQDPTFEYSSGDQDVMSECVSVTTDASSNVIMTWRIPNNRLLYALGNDTGTFVTEPMIYKASGDYIDISCNGQGNAPYEAVPSVILPTVTSIVRVNTNPTSAASVKFAVTFSEPVTDVSIDDFALYTTGTVAGASIQNVSGSDAFYTVTVNTGAGYGSLRLDVPITATIHDLAGNSLSSLPFIAGETYSLARNNGADTTGVFRPSNGILFLKNSHNTGFADVGLNYGIPGDYPVVGDWDGNGTVTIGVYRNGSFYLRNSNTIGFADLAFLFGQPGDQPIAGDWNGDGIDTIGIYRPSTGQFQLRNSNSEGPADKSFYLGNVGDVGIAGDWDGDGKDTTGVFRPINGIIFLKNANETGFADVALNYGIPGDKPVTGDWDNDGVDTIGVYRNGQFLLRNSNTVGFAEIVFGLGNPGDMPIAGNWDGLP